jgi:type III restriction enzyme
MMKLQFKQQQFQLDAVRAVVDCFEGQERHENRFTLERAQRLMKQAKEAAAGGGVQAEAALMEEIGYRNTPIQLLEEQVLENIHTVQQRNDIRQSEKLEHVAGLKSGYNLTIDMETGTGKTYVYIRTMYELHRAYGWSKFIVIVPSIAIREGVYQSFDDMAEHFQELYGHRIRPFIYNSKRPQDIETFASDSRISVMVINTQAFAARGEDARRIYMELDDFASRRPIDIIAQTNPILIIDEPQSVDGPVALKAMQDFRPLLTIRYSATHKQDYNKIFRLDALDAYNRKLVKRIEVKGLQLKGSTGTTGYLYLEQVIASREKKPVAVLEFEKRMANGHKRVSQRVNEGDNLFALSKEMPQYQNMTVRNINALTNTIEVNGMTIAAGEAVGNVDELAFRRIQIRETIKSHLTKEKQLFGRGIKVLSLFFIDTVENYRKYDAAGEKVLGDFARIFEEEYNNQRSDYLDLFNQEYNDYLLNTDPSKVHKAYMPGSYEEYLNRDDAERVHSGYFSIDKEKRMVDPTVKRGKDDSEDVSAYDLIMKEKKLLLSFDTPVRFIFSHSALKEGWDNPNVFQICALKNPEGGSTIRRRQEVGRGMRLCVNDHGVRQDSEQVGDAVHDINRLTVIASESYEEFAKGLQKEIAETLKDRPTKVTTALFERMVEDANGTKRKLDIMESTMLFNHLMFAQVVDPKGNVTETGREHIDKNTVPLPDELVPFRAEITRILQSVYSGEPLKPEDADKAMPVKVNANFYRKEFEELWKRINIRSIYEVQFDTDKLIQDSVNRLNRDLTVSDRTYEVKVGELDRTTVEAMQGGEAFRQTSRSSKKLTADLYTNTTYDLIGEIETKTNLTRRTITTILKGIKPQQFLLVRKNPEEFIAKCGNLINDVKASLILNNIVYHKTEEYYDASTVFTNDKKALRTDDVLKKHIYDYIVTDSETERKFAEALDTSTEVVVYAKLPTTFKISTPVADYSPDWAIVFDKDKVRHIYFVAETKGSDSDLNLRELEKLKIHCASEHFKAISGTEVRFDRVASYEKMLEIVQLK